MYNIYYKTQKWTICTDKDGNRMIFHKGKFECPKVNEDSIDFGTFEKIPSHVKRKFIKLNKKGFEGEIKDTVDDLTF